MIRAAVLALLAALLAAALLQAVVDRTDLPVLVDVAIGAVGVLGAAGAVYAHERPDARHRPPRP